MSANSIPPVCMRKSLCLLTAYKKVRLCLLTAYILNEKGDRRFSLETWDFLLWGPTRKNILRKLNIILGTLLYYIVLYCTVLYCIILYFTVLYLLYCTKLYCIVFYCIVLHCTVLCFTILYCIVLYCIVL